MNVFICPICLCFGNGYGSRSLDFHFFGSFMEKDPFLVLNRSHGLCSLKEMIRLMLSHGIIVKSSCTPITDKKFTYLDLRLFNPLTSFKFG